LIPAFAGMTNFIEFRFLRVHQVWPIAKTGLDLEMIGSQTHLQFAKY